MSRCLISLSETLGHVLVVFEMFCYVCLGHVLVLF